LHAVLRLFKSARAWHEKKDRPCEHTRAVKNSSSS
jgi:uncharacterized protein YecT (DUF1311 family)